jgi:hypothetical protein
LMIRTSNRIFVAQQKKNIEKPCCQQNRFHILPLGSPHCKALSTK